MDAVRRIGTFGLFGIGNLGNEGSLEAVLTALRRVVPAPELCCMCAEPDAVSAMHGIATVPMRTRSLAGIERTGAARLLERLRLELADWRATIQYVRRYRFIIVPGTGLLDDFGDRPWGMPLAIFRLCLLAKIAGTKVWFVSIGAGPIHHPVSRRLMLWAARLASYRSYRDRLSRDYMAGLGLDVTMDRVYPDVAFALPAPAHQEAGNPSPKATIGVGVMAYYGWNGPDQGQTIHAAYIERITKFVTWLLEHGYRVRLITGETSDEKAVARVRQIVVNQIPDIPAGDLIAQACRLIAGRDGTMADCETVVATRFHNVVCALRLGKPVISIGYASKFDALMTDMGLAAFCQDVEHLDIEKLKSQFQALMLTKSQISTAIKVRTSHYQDLLQQQNAVLLGMLQTG